MMRSAIGAAPMFTFNQLWTQPASIAARMFCWKSKSVLSRGSSNVQRAKLVAYLAEG